MTNLYKLPSKHVNAELSSELDGAWETNHIHCHIVLGSVRDQRESSGKSKSSLVKMHVVGFSLDTILVLGKSMCLLGLPYDGKILRRYAMLTGKLLICFFFKEKKKDIKKTKQIIKFIKLH